MSELDDIYKIHKNLYIGAYWPRLNFEKIKKEGITAIVNLMERKHYHPPFFRFSYLHEGFPDNSYIPQKDLRKILKFIDKHIKTGKVLVHCAMGISRSGGIVVAWLLKENPSWSWSDAIKYVNKTREVYPAIEIRESILDYLELVEGYRRDY